jgi:hypothetical protein
MADHRIGGVEFQQAVHHSAGAHEPLAHDGVQRRQPPHQQQIHGQIDVAAHRLAHQAQGTAKVRSSNVIPVQFEKSDPAGQRLTALADQLHRSRAQQQEPAQAPALAPAGIHLPSQLSKGIEQPLQLSEDDELVGMALQNEGRFGQPGAVGGRLEIEVLAGQGVRQLESQVGLARLAGAEERHGRELPQPLAHEIRLQARDPGWFFLVNRAWRAGFARTSSVAA